MAASGFLTTTQGTVRALEPWLPETSGSWRVKGQKEQGPVSTAADFGGKGSAEENLYLSLAFVNNMVCKMHSVPVEH